MKSPGFNRCLHQKKPDRSGAAVTVAASGNPANLDVVKLFDVVRDPSPVNFRPLITQRFG
jgi:hypothetical protein